MREKQIHYCLVTVMTQCANVILVTRSSGGAKGGLTYPTRMGGKLGKTSLRT